MISRRQIVFALGAVALAAPHALFAQTPKILRRISILSVGTIGSSGHLTEFRGALKELGWVEDRNTVIEVRYANDQIKRLDTLAAELVSLKPDLIFAPSTQSAVAAQRATRDIPIVFALPLDPIGSGLIASFARQSLSVNISGRSFTTKSFELYAGKQTFRALKLHNLRPLHVNEQDTSF